MTSTSAAHTAGGRRAPVRRGTERDDAGGSYSPVPLEPIRPEGDLVEGPKRWVLTTKHHIEEHCDHVENAGWSPEPACGAREHAQEASR